MPLKDCLLNPIDEIQTAAHLLQSAVAFHINSKTDLAASCIKEADMPAITDWTEALWGGFNPNIHHLREIPNTPPLLPKDQRIKMRMPSKDEKRLIIQRDGYNCRFCKIPVISPDIRKAMHKLYPDSARWGPKNADQHAAFQAMWLQFDHVLPHSRGGTNDLENIVITCAPCNFSRMQWTLEELGLKDPRKDKAFRKTTWDGLERFRQVM